MTVTLPSPCSVANGAADGCQRRRASSPNGVPSPSAERELRAQLAVVRVADRSEHRERVDAARQEDRDEHRLRAARSRRCAMPSSKRPSSAASAVDRQRERRPCARTKRAPRSSPVPAGSGMPGLDRRQPAPASAPHGAELGAREVVAAVAAAISRSGGRGTMATSMRSAFSASAGYALLLPVGWSAPPSARRAKRYSARACRGEIVGLAPERERAVDGASGSSAVEGPCRRSSACGRERVARRSASGRATWRCRASGRRPSPRRSAGRRAAGRQVDQPRPGLGVDPTAASSAAGRRCRRPAASPCAVRRRGRVLEDRLDHRAASRARATYSRSSARFVAAGGGVGMK